MLNNVGWWLGVLLAAVGTGCPQGHQCVHTPPHSWRLNGYVRASGGRLAHSNPRLSPRPRLTAHTNATLRLPQMFEKVGDIDHKVARRHKITPSRQTLNRYKRSIAHYWPRQMVASTAWLANGFAFYGSKLQQDLFITMLYPQVCVNVLLDTDVQCL